VAERAFFSLSNGPTALELLGVEDALAFVPAAPVSGAAGAGTGADVVGNALGVFAIPRNVLTSGKAVNAILFTSEHPLKDVASRPVVITTTVFFNLFLDIFSTFSILSLNYDL
jgi:hypothetical protein